MGLRHRRLLTLLASGLLLTGVLTGLGQRAATGQTAVADPERNSQAEVTWSLSADATPLRIDALKSNGWRVVDLEVNSTAPTFTVSYVRNTGVFARTWWWARDLTQSQVTGMVNTNNGRLIDVEPYGTAAGTRFAVVMVANAGTAKKTWKWLPNASMATVNYQAATLGMRLIDVETLPRSTNVSALLIANTGVDRKETWTYRDVTLTQVGSYLRANAARATHLETLSNGNYDVIMQRRVTGENSWLVTNLTESKLRDAASIRGARIFQAESRMVSGVRLFDALLISSANAETRRIRNLAGARMTGNWGFYLKPVGGSPLLSLGADVTFEPASMIKIVHAVTAMRDVMNTATELWDYASWPLHPNFAAAFPSSAGYRTSDPTDIDHADICPYNAEGVLLETHYATGDLEDVIQYTMVYSDNRATDYLTRRYGFSGLNQTIALAGMTKSAVRHRVGCAAAASPQPFAQNQMTLIDAGRIYEKIQDRTILDAVTAGRLLTNMFGGQPSGSLKQMIEVEAAAAGLTAAETTNFLSRTVIRAKGGTYNYCPSSGTCNPPTVQSRTDGGLLRLPYVASTGRVALRAFVFGRFFDVQVNCTSMAVFSDTCPAFESNETGMNQVAVELFRAEVKKALATW